MKTPCYLLLASSITLLAQDANYKQLIYQYEYDENDTLITFHQKEVGKNGTIDAIDGVDHSSTFELYCINLDTNTPTFIADKTVSAYLPTGSISISSLDTNVTNGVYNTRVDQEYTVSYTVGGLVLDDPTIKDAAKMVNFDTSLVTYAEGETTHTSDSEVEDTRTTLTENATKSDKYSNQIENTKSGQASYSILPLADFGVDGDSSLDRKAINIWPLASGSITGFSGDQRFTSPPIVTVTVHNIYPRGEVRTYIVNATTGERLEIDQPFQGLENGVSSPAPAPRGGSEIQDFLVDGEKFYFEIIETFDESINFPDRSLDQTPTRLYKPKVTINSNITSAE